MNIIEIIAQENGGHRNQFGALDCPKGYAIIPDSMAIPEEFPFVNIEVNGKTVVSMKAGKVPEVVPEVIPPTTEEILTESVVDLQYRVILLELGLTEEDL